MFEVQRFEFALERLVSQGTKRPEGKGFHAWLEEIRRMPPGILRKLLRLPQSDRNEVQALLDVRHVFAHELLLAGKDQSPRFDPALANLLIADMRALAGSARELRSRLEAEWSRCTPFQ